MFAWNEPLGRAIRAPLQLLPKSAVVPILSGPNAGLRWIVGSGTHGCWLGWYDRESAALLQALCRPGMTVFDVGANVGYFTLLLSRAVGLTGKVIAFEPDPSNLTNLRRNLRANAMDNVSVLAAAVTDKEGEACFESAASMGRVCATGALSVRTCCLDDFSSPYVVKMDIEGGEVTALLGAERILNEGRTAWLIEIHGDCLTPCSNILLQAGYRLKTIGHNCLLARPGDSSSSRLQAASGRP